jgi:hypothetical protein
MIDKKEVLQYSLNVDGAVMIQKKEVLFVDFLAWY